MECDKPDSDIDQRIHIPPIPPEVTSKILKNLDPRELRNSRLVCTDWNWISVEQIHKHKEVKELCLTSDELIQYAKFVKRTGATNLFPVQINLHYQEADQVDVEGIGAALDSLIHSIGPEPITALQVDFQGHVAESECKGVLPILEKLAPHLKSLLISVKKQYYGSSTYPGGQVMARSLVAALQGKPDLTFPNLTKLQFKPSTDRSIESRHEWVLYSTILGRCPALQDFQFFGPLKRERDEIAINVNPRRLKHLALHGLINWAQLYSQLGIGEDVDADEQPMPPKPAPLLQTLDIGFGVVWTDDSVSREAYKNGMSHILAAYSKELKKLSQCLLIRDDSSDSLPIFLVQMPALEDLTIQVHFDTLASTLPMYLDASRINFTPQFLPALRSVTIPTGILWFRIFDQAFESVTSLNFQIPDGDGLRGERALPTTDALSAEFANDSLHSSFRIFPNVRELGLSAVGANKGSYIKLILKKLLSQPPARGIVQELTVSNYKVDYIGEVLQELAYHHTPGGLGEMGRMISALQEIEEGGEGLALDGCAKESSIGARAAEDIQTGHLLKYIRRLKLIKQTDDEPALALDYQEDSEHPASAGTLHLSTIVTCFPCLRTLELTGNLLTYSSDKNAASDLGREIEEVFSNLEVKLI